jgi:LysM repeat protein
MKTSHFLTVISLVLATPKVSAMTELEKLRARCVEQESQIRRLQEENARLKGVKSESSATTAKAQETPAVRPSDDAASSVYSVRKGDSIERIARKNGCSAEKLAKANGLKCDSIIQPGQKLKLPGATVSKSQSSPSHADKPADDGDSKAVAGKSHKLEEGETYSSISRKYGVSVNSLIAANPDASPTKLRDGQIIRIPSGGKVASTKEVAGKEVASKEAKPESKPKPDSAVVASKEKPASKPQTETAMKSNAEPSQASRKPLGSSTTIPVSTRNESAESSRNAEAGDVAEDATSAPQSTPSPSPEKKIHSVKIQGEMTYGEFAAKHGTDTSRLNDLNGLDLTNATVLAKGSELYVPAQP